MTVYEFSNERRYDPEIRAKVEAIHKARQAMLLKAAAELDRLVEEMRPLMDGGDDRMYEKAFDDLRRARYTMVDTAEFMQDIGSETYIGNLAAGRLGEYVEKLALGSEA